MSDHVHPDSLALAIAVCNAAGKVVIDRSDAVDADSQLSAIGHGRPPEKDECLRLSALIRKAYSGR